MEDLQMLVEHFLARVQPPRSLADVPPPVWDMFRAHRWPGNVRELNNAVQRLLVTPERALRPSAPSEAPKSSISGLTPAAGSIVPLRIARREAGESFEKVYLEALLARTSGNVTRAAAIAEVSRQMIQKMMKKHGLS
jgi:two-component system nitrogen regulation response regulator NtrX